MSSRYFFHGGASSRGSTIQGGGNVNLTSTQGDIHVVQGNLSAGNTLSLDSAGDILLEAGKAHVADRSKSSNAGAEVGVGVSVGAQTGVYVYAEASVGSSKANAESSTWQNTTLTGKNISMKAEGDTTLRGATATADRIDVKTGGTLTIESLQDIAESMSRNSQVGGRVQCRLASAWNADGYASAGKASDSYQGVGQQSGLFGQRRIPRRCRPLEHWWAGRLPAPMRATGWAGRKSHSWSPSGPREWWCGRGDGWRGA